jgi:hypothetical protein
VGKGKEVAWTKEFEVVRGNECDGLRTHLWLPLSLKAFWVLVLHCVLEGVSVMHSDYQNSFCNLPLLVGDSLTKPYYKFPMYIISKFEP